MPADEPAGNVPARSPLRVVVMGSTAFVLPSLERLVAAPEIDVVAVYSRPPAARGRGQHLQRTAVHERALALGLPVETPASFKDPQAVDTLAAWNPDVVVTGAYGLILPKNVLAIPRHGCINLHASLLPRWRGAAPIERAILAGDQVTGVCLFQMEPGLDTGPVYARATVPIGPATTAMELHEKLADVAASLLLPVLAGLRDGSVTAVAQPDDGVTYAAKLSKDERRLDFSRPAADLERTIRALEPRPGAFVLLDGERIGVRAATVVDGETGPPGELVASPLVVACGQGALRLDVIQRAGKKAMAAQEALRGWRVPPGTRFDPV